jgi:hypothetical protein
MKNTNEQLYNSTEKTKSEKVVATREGCDAITGFFSRISSELNNRMKNFADKL